MGATVKYCLFLGGLLCQHFLLAQNQHRIDSLEKLSASTNNDSIKIECYLQLGTEYGSANPPKAVKYFRKATDFAGKEVPNSLSHLISLNQHGLFYARRNRLDSAIKYLKAGYIAAGSTKHIIRAQIGSNLGYAYLSSGNLAEATATYNSVQSQIESSKDSALLSDFYARMGVLERQKIT